MGETKKPKLSAGIMVLEPDSAKCLRRRSGGGSGRRGRESPTRSLFGAEEMDRWGVVRSLSQVSGISNDLSLAKL